MPSRPASNGFSLLEMLVAIGVLAICLMPILELQITLDRRHAERQLALDRLTAQRSALALLRGINPSLEPVGIRTLAPATTLRWQAVPLSTPRRALHFLGGEAYHDITLYRIVATLTRPDHRFAVEAIGWQPAPRPVLRLATPPAAGTSPPAAGATPPAGK